MGDRFDGGMLLNDFLDDDNGEMDEVLFLRVAE